MSGLRAATSLVLENNGDTPVKVNAGGAFSFSTMVTADSVYSVTVQMQSTWWNRCASNGSGTSSVNVTNLSLPCAVARATVSSLANEAAFGSAKDASGTKLVGMAVDGSGKLYASDNNDGDVFGLAAGSGAPHYVYTSAGSAGLKEYGAKNATLYAADGGDSYVVELPDSLLGGATAYLEQGPVTTMNGAAVDSSDNVHVVDTGATPFVVEEFRSVGTTIAMLASGTSIFTRYAVAVDSAGNVYVADKTRIELLKLVSSTPTVLAGSGTAADRRHSRGGIAERASGDYRGRGQQPLHGGFRQHCRAPDHSVVQSGHDVGDANRRHGGGGGRKR
ncbi:hypothetical protein ACFSHT_40685 [Paraburkholderia silviterrae]|uniref:NHL repeat-containing protein n=1 Tax=Paraburkholderia silviterrae TaxID=2528715 RepID=A0A4R5M2F8_9BURK|nr:hypothetical protein [Paraburkholderia silviterrae]TDG19148.1 hypothetical protein EYW47_31985 [Paraburkholderia silviterrae]